MKIDIGQIPYPGNQDRYQDYDLEIDELLSLNTGYVKPNSRIDDMDVLEIS